MKGFFKKAWHFLWHDESWYAFIAQILVAFIVIKFILYPAVGLIFGTQLPVVAVVSSSMEHRGESMCGVEAQEDWWSTCGEWYTQRNITQEDFEAFPLDNGFNKGDVIALRGVAPDKLEVGDVIVYSANKQYPIIHRIVAVEETFTTKGDNNPEPIRQYVLTNGYVSSECYQQSGGRIILTQCSPNSQRVTAETPGAVAVLDETQITDEMIIGKAYGRIPYAGYVKIWFVQLLDFIGLDALANRI